MEQNRSEEITQSFFNVLHRNIEELITKKVDIKYTITDIADQLFIHPTHLSNVIKEVTGKSPCDLFEEAYLNKSKHLLTHTRLKIFEIAHSLGFKEATNFSKFFKNYMGLTPGQFRKQSKN